MRVRSLFAWCVFVSVVLLLPRPSSSVPRGLTDGTDARKFVPKPTKLALVIGINTYRNKYWSRLDFASRDAHRFAQMLALGGFSSTLRLTTPQQTTLASIRLALQRLRKRNRNPQDTVVVYISAHGTLLGDSDRKRGRRYIIAADTDDENVAETGIEVRWLRAELQRFLSRRKVLILGTCHSQRQGSKSQKVRGQKGGLTGALEPRSTTMLILNAASYRYAAYESKKLRADVYTHFLLDCIYALKRKRGHGARVSAIEAHECSVKKTYRYVYRSRKVYQLPGLVSDVRGLNAVYFFGQPAPLLDQKEMGAAQKQELLSKGGGRAIIQIPADLLERYKLQIFRRKGKLESLVETYAHRGEMVVTLAPGRYRFRFARRRSHDHAEQILDLGMTDRLMLSPPKQFMHIFSIAGGATQLGAPPLRTLHPYLALDYRLRPLPWIFVGVGIGWAIGQQPDGPAQFDLHRFELLRLEGGFILWSQQRLNLSLGLYGLVGADLSFHLPTGRSTVSPAGGFGGQIALVCWLTDHIGIRAGGDLGLDLALVGSPAVLTPSLAWKARLGFLLRVW